MRRFLRPPLSLQEFVSGVESSGAGAAAAAGVKFRGTRGNGDVAPAPGAGVVNSRVLVTGVYTGFDCVSGTCMREADVTPARPGALVRSALVVRYKEDPALGFGNTPVDSPPVYCGRVAVAM